MHDFVLYYFSIEMPMGQMPVLEIDGKKYNQSKSICRYLGKKFNLYGSNDLEALEIDAAADDIDDMRIRKCQFISKNKIINFLTKLSLFKKNLISLNPLNISFKLFTFICANNVIVIYYHFLMIVENK